MMPTETRQHSVEAELHWTDHYVKYGFAIVPNVLETGYINEAQDEVCRLVGNGLPFEQWTVDNVPNRSGDILHWNSPGGKETPVLNRVYEQPHVRAAINELFGSPNLYNGKRDLSLFIKPYDPNAEPMLRPVGHVDFVKKPIPIFGSGTTFQVSLVDKDPFGGNLTVWPSTHRLVQKCLIENPDWQYPTNWGDIPVSDPFEFVPAAGDMIFIHHLVAHQGNPCCTRMPRISLHCLACQNEWVTEIGPDQPALSPLLRSLAQNGKYKLPFNEKEKIRAHAAAKSR